MKVAWFDAGDWHEEYVDSGHEIEFFEASANLEDLDDSYDVVSVFVNSDVGEDIIESVRPEKVLCRSSGYDNVDTEAAERYGLTVQNVPDYGSETVAEYTFALLLNEAKKLNEDIGKNPNKDEGLQGYELKDKTLGVIGAGKIGREVLKRAKAFKMNILAYDPYPDEEAAEEIGYSYVELEELLQASDFVSINCPLTDATHHLLSSEEFDLMSDVILVNTARGPIIDSEALLQGLKDGSISSAALDVVENGEYSKLSEHEKVYFTPHNAYNTREAEKRIVDTTVENIGNEKNTVM